MRLYNGLTRAQCAVLEAVAQCGPHASEQRIAAYMSYNEFGQAIVRMRRELAMMADYSGDNDILTHCHDIGAALDSLRSRCDTLKAKRQ